MLSLGSTRTCASLMRRCSCLKPSTSAVWGTMSAGQAVRHLSGSFHMALGSTPPAQLLTSSRSFLNSRLGRHLVLASPIPWAHGVPTLPELDATRKPPPPPELFEQDLADLLLLIRHFPEAPTLLPDHPFLGPLTRDQWMRWGYLHTDHHLRQFGC